MLKLLTKNGIEGFKAKEFWDADEALSVIFGASPCSREYWIWSEDELEIPSLVERDLLWLEILKAIKDGSLQTYEEISRSRLEEETGEENEEKRINWDLIEYGNRSKNGYESNLKPQFRHYAFTCFTLEPKEYVAWYFSTQRRYQISPAFQVRKNDKGDYEWVHPPNYLEYVIAYKDPLNGIEETTPTNISAYKKLPYWTVWEALCLIKGLLPPEDPKKAFEDSRGKQNLQRIIERDVKVGKLPSFSPDVPEGFNPFLLLDYLRQQAEYSIPPYFDFVKTVNDSGETDYRWADDEVKKTKETGLAKNIPGELKNYDQIEKSTIDLKWGGITATFLNETEILFQYSGESMEKNYKQLGFEDGRNGKPIKAWDDFMEASRIDGQIRYPLSKRSAVEKRVEFIRKKLKEFFPGVEGDPLPHKSEYYKFEIHVKNNISD